MKPILEPVLTQCRILKIRSYLYKNIKPVVLDIGCGENFLLLNGIKDKIDKGYGIDKQIVNKSIENITLINKNIEKGIPFQKDEIDIITMLAVLEHMNNPLFILKEIERVLKPGGMLLLTVPTLWSKPVLEFLAFNLGIVDPIQIRDHKTYYSEQLLVELFSNVDGLFIEKHHYFQIYMNNFIVGKKYN